MVNIIRGYNLWTSENLRLGMLEGTLKTDVPGYKTRHSGVWARRALGHVEFEFTVK